MKVTILCCVIGALGLEDDGRIVDKVLFPKDPAEVAKRLAIIRSGEVVEEVVDLVKRLKGMGYDRFVFESPELARSLRERLSVEAEVVKPSDVGRALRRGLSAIAVNAGFVERPEGFHSFLHQVSMNLAKECVRKAEEKRDLLVVQAIKTIDDLDEALNLFVNRVREWYGVHFPELSKLVEEHGLYVKIASCAKSKDELTREELEELGLPSWKATRIVEVARTSMGARLEDVDVEQIRRICKTVLELHELRRSLEGYVEGLMEDVAPNVKALVGSLLGARLIALAGGLEGLAKMPASTVQVLGAEKALFRALRTGARPPKHGIIFQHAYLHDVKKWQRGKVARALAGKLAIAARADAFSSKYIGDELRASLEKRIKEIQEKHEEPSLTKPTVRPLKRPREGVRRGRKG